MLKLGIVTPVLTLLPRAHAAWEETGTFAEVVGIVREADRLGYHHCTCSEHVAIPVEVAETRGARYWDPLATFGALSAHTSTIRFAAHVLVLGYHHPLAIAKRYGTLDEIAGGRVILGVGVGSLREEFELLGAPFDDRGERADDAMRALRASLSQREPEYHGAYYDFGGFVDRSARAASARSALGRRSHRAFVAPRGRARRRLGAVRPAHRRARRDARPARDTEAWSPRATRSRCVLQNEHPLDPLGEPDRVAEQLAKFARDRCDRSQRPLRASLPRRTTESNSPRSRPTARDARRQYG